MNNPAGRTWRRTAWSALALLLVAQPAPAQERLEELPGYERYVKVNEALRKVTRSPVVEDLTWTEDALLFRRGDERFRCSLADGSTIPIADEPSSTAASQSASSAPTAPPRRRPSRGRQADEEPSPDGRWMARCQDFNVMLLDRTTDETHPVTTTGTRKHKFGSASWVYGEELEQTTAMWWSPDSRRLAYYEFDETRVLDFALPTGWTGMRLGSESEGYPKAGEANPIARLHIYDVLEGGEVAVEVGPDTEQYIYDVRFSSNGEWLLFNRTNRRQDRLELVAADPKTGATRVVVTETQPTWQKNRPEIRFLTDGRRFIWETERSGWKQYEMRSLTDDSVLELTTGSYPADRIVSVDEDRGWMHYGAFSGSNALSRQLHRVNLDGTNQQPVTDGVAHYSDFELSPDARWLVCTEQAVNEAPRRVLVDTSTGDPFVGLALVETSALAGLNLHPPELFTVLAADGATTLYGTLHKPSTFDASKRYPLVIEVYGGPLSQSVRNLWNPAVAACEFGFLIAEIDNRGTLGRGKAFESAGYLKLGQIDLDDQVAAVKQLCERPYVDAARVGIAGHSYGGYMAALAIVKYPEVFRAAVAGAPLTDLANYDTIYTERYMRTPKENPEGYDAASCLTYVDHYRGGLLLLQGMVDDNVHATNTFQLAHALQVADKPFEMMLFPTSGHGIGSPLYRTMRWTFLYRRLIAAP